MNIPTSISIGNISVRIRISKKAKSMILQVKNFEGYIEMVVPTKYQFHHKDMHNFFIEKIEWIRQNHSKIHKSIPFRHNVTIPVENVPLTIKHIKESHAEPHIKDNELRVGGKPQLIPYKIRKFLKEKTKERVTKSIAFYTKKLNIEHKGKIIISSNRRSWGSCNFRSKSLYFNWRLILAPTYVADHVVAHEVSHLIVPNHSSRFYEVLREIEPDIDKSNKWLKNNSALLFAYSREDNL